MTQATVEFTPTVAGDYVYMCGYHSDMVGVITVEGGATTTTYEVTVSSSNYFDYQLTGSDKYSTFSSADSSQDDPSITIAQGDTMRFVVGVDSFHPFYIRHGMDYTSDPMNNVAPAELALISGSSGPDGG